MLQLPNENQTQKKKENKMPDAKSNSHGHGCLWWILLPRILLSLRLLWWYMEGVMGGE